jgi:hypothetical protein
VESVSLLSQTFAQPPCSYHLHQQIYRYKDGDVHGVRIVGTFKRIRQLIQNC